MIRRLVPGLMTLAVVASHAWASEPGTSQSHASIGDSDPLVQATKLREAVNRGLPYLERDGVAWLDERGCLSCHHYPLMLWAHRSALDHGFPVDKLKLNQWDVRAQENSHQHRQKYKLEKARLESLSLPLEVQERLKPVIDRPFVSKQDFLEQLSAALTDDQQKSYLEMVIKEAEIPLYSSQRSGGGLDVLSLLLLGGNRTSAAADENHFAAGTYQLILEMQLADGAWTPGNQFLTMRQWSKSTAMLAALALDGRRDQPAAAEERTIGFLRQQLPQFENSEWVATRLMFESRFGDKQSTTETRDRLAASQGPDGGWSWLQGGESDPYTTGLVLYSLSRAGDGCPDRVFSSAVTYLLENQQADGS